MEADGSPGGVGGMHTIMEWVKWVPAEDGYVASVMMTLPDGNFQSAWKAYDSQEEANEALPALRRYVLARLTDWVVRDAIFRSRVTTIPV